MHPTQIRLKNNELQTNCIQINCIQSKTKKYYSQQVNCTLKPTRIMNLENNNIKLKKISIEVLIEVREKKLLIADLTSN